MKKLLLAAIFILALASTNAQDEKNVIKINPIGILIGSANLGYERALGPKSSILIAPSYGYIKSSGTKYNVYGLGLEYRIYFSGRKYAPRGWYVAPGLEFAGGSAKTEDGNGNSDKVEVKGFSIKAIAGHQWIFRGGFVIDLNAGVQYVNLDAQENSQGIGNFNGILPTLAFGIGYAF